MDNNGEHILNIFRENEIVIANKLFSHCLVHCATWAVLERVTNITSRDGYIRRNPL